MANPKKIGGVVISIDSVGTGVYRLQLTPDGAVPRYMAGHFLHLTLDDYDPAGGFWPESRVFSIASSYGDPYIEIVFSVKGRYTRLMEEQLKPGRPVWLKLPYGDFIIDALAGGVADVVLIAGGTGISPYLPYLKQMESREPAGRRVRLYYGVRENSMILSEELLTRMSQAGLADIRIYIQNEEPEDGLSVRNRAFHGSLDIDMIHKESDDLKNPVYFISGPPMMIEQFKRKLLALGVGSKMIKIDEWE